MKRRRVPDRPRLVLVRVSGRTVAELLVTSSGDIVPGSLVWTAKPEGVSGPDRERAPSERLKPMRTALLITSLLCLAASPPAVVEVPRGEPGEWKELKALPGRLLRLGAEPASKWLLVDDEGADLLPADGGKFGDFAAPMPGRYKVVVTGPDGVSARIVIVVGDAPAPKPPTPNDPLRAKLKQAYDADTGTDKVESVKLLVELYKQLADKVCPDPTILTVGDLLARSRDASAALLKAEQLAGVRRVVRDELAVIFPADGELTAEQRTKTAALFKRLATLLEGF